MRVTQRFLPEHLHRRDATRLLAMMALFFLVVCAVGILRPIKNAFALDGLGATDFYKVYLVSAAVILFVPLYNRLADRIDWRWLFPGVAGFFALNLIIFRLLYSEGSTVQGMLFYGWYDLFAAALVTQFFMATQLFFNARNAKRAYPLVIAGGSLGATLGGAITGFFAERVGTPNLLLVAAALIALFAIGLPFVWAGEAPVRKPGVSRTEKLSAGEFRSLLAHPHVRLIAASVLLTVLVKQLVDYEFNTITKSVFETRDAISAFQGKFNAATQWLPLVVVLALGPLLRRWGIGVAVLLLPVFMLGTTAGMAIWFGLWTVVAAKGSDAALRYSAERTGREILYVPLPEDLKLKAKTYIDVAVEKGIGKVASAGLIFLLLLVMDHRQIAWVAAGLALLAVGVSVVVRREYVRSLARSIERRSTTLRGGSASLADASTRKVVGRALAAGDPLQAAFTLDLLEQSGPVETRPFAADLHRLLASPTAELRVRALSVLARIPEEVDEAQVRERLDDSDAAVRQGAVRVLCMLHPESRDEILRELLGSPEPAIRTAALSSLALGEVSSSGARLIGAEYLSRHGPDVGGGDSHARMELALAAVALEEKGETPAELLEPLLRDPEPSVAAAALRSAGLLKLSAFYPQMIEALGAPGTRSAARDALARQGEGVVDLLAERLLDESTPAPIRRNLPAVLARIPTPASVHWLMHSVLAPETDQLLDFRTLKALNRLRARHPTLCFAERLVLEMVDRERNAAGRYAAAIAALTPHECESPLVALLTRALHEAWRERREGVFRCLGLIHPPREVHRCYLAVAGGTPRARANGLEWLENTLGRRMFGRVEPVAVPAPTRQSLAPTAEQALSTLLTDGDAWVARCAQRARDELRGATQPRSRSRAARDSMISPDEPGRADMDLIEKVFLLQRIDLLQGATTAQLSLLGSIADEVEAAPGTVLLPEGEPADALYVVIQGTVELRRENEPVLEAVEGDSFGTWSLIDQAASIAEARAVTRCTLLRITREDFYDCLADQPELALGLLQGLARRVRALVS